MRRRAEENLPKEGVPKEVMAVLQCSMDAHARRTGKASSPPDPLVDIQSKTPEDPWEYTVASGVSMDADCNADLDENARDSAAYVAMAYKAGTPAEKAAQAKRDEGHDVMGIMSGSAVYQWDPTFILVAFSFL